MMLLKSNTLQVASRLNHETNWDNVGVRIVAEGELLICLAKILSYDFFYHLDR
ncbi:hypothetical protein C7460_10864 [Marinoscillum furvescens DSM 4134]|uniref:Uncharacterized protein n=1 Tax=Marinoscillum furvescens DSM 4134 TaxID=1122208 RepID=A0A3D9L459_MARFU|nr:hypothetical protein C7460_10864 [Marinoscillum furvescens DSM 4134]